MLLKFNDEEKTVKVNLKAESLLPKLHGQHTSKSTTIWHPEFAAYMIEATPSEPYGNVDCGTASSLSCFNRVEANMRSRRAELEKLLDRDEALFSITSFPRLGCPSFTHPPTTIDTSEGAGRSLFFSDECIYQGHPRFT